MSVKIKLIVAMMMCLLITGSAAYGEGEGSIGGNQPAGEQYVTVENARAVLSNGLQAGDQVILYNMEGEEILSQCVINYTDSVDLSTIPEGIYTMLVCRSGKVVETKQVPFIGMEGR